MRELSVNLIRYVFKTEIVIFSDGACWATKAKTRKKKMLLFDSFMRTVTDRAGEREEISRYRVRQHFSDSIQYFNMKTKKKKANADSFSR